MLKNQKNPELSIVRDLENKKNNIEAGAVLVQELNFKHYVVFIVVLAFFALLVYGGANWGWNLKHSAALFIWMAIVGGLAYGFGPSAIAKEFVDGAKN